MFYNIGCRTNTSTSPFSAPEYWAQQADWKIIRFENGFLIKNYRFDEYLYEVGEDNAHDTNHISVFTTENLNSLGLNGIWRFQYDFSGKICKILKYSKISAIAVIKKRHIKHG